VALAVNYLTFVGWFEIFCFVPEPVSNSGAPRFPAGPRDGPQPPMLVASRRSRGARSI